MKEKRTMLFCSMIAMLFLLTGCINLSLNKEAMARDNTMPTYNDTNIDNAIPKITNKFTSNKIITFHVIGKGIAPDNATSKGQAILLGESAARSDGYLKLVEKINGIYIDSYKRVGNGAVNYDLMHMETRAWLRGAEVMDIKQINNGIFEAYMRVRVKVTRGHPLYHLSNI